MAKRYTSGLFAASSEFGNAVSRFSRELKQVVDLIPAYLVPKLARKHGGDKKSRSFTPWSHVVSLVHAQLAAHFLLLTAAIFSPRSLIRWSGLD